MNKRIEVINRKLLRLTSLFIALLVCFAVTAPALAVLPITEFDIEQINKDQYYRDPEIVIKLCGTDSYSPPGSSIFAGGKIYLIGDSISDGARVKLSSASTPTGGKLEFSKISAFVGRSIGATGSGTETGLQSIQNDSDIIQNSDRVVIELGTNAVSANLNGITGMINAIKAANPDISSDKIYWVNLFSAVANKESFNALLAQESSKQGFQIIDAASAGIELSPDNIHPNGKGYDSFVNLIARSLSVAPATNSQIDATTYASGIVSKSTLSDIAVSKLKSVEEKVNQNMDVYVQAASAENLPWQVLAAVHYREGGNDPNKSLLGGEPLGTKAVDTENTPETLLESANLAAGHLKAMAKSVYGVELTANSSFEDLQLAFLSYNRGFLYKNVPAEEGGPWGPDIAPYVMNFYDEAHGANDNGMVRPKGTSGAIGGRTSSGKRWGETVSGYDANAGAMTFLAYFGLNTTSTSGSCSASKGGAGFVDNFRIFKQNDPLWADNAYGPGTISADGCGPSAMAMIITALTGQTVTPAETADFGNNNRTYTSEGGSDGVALAEKMAQKWGLKATYLGPSETEINNTLRTGGLVIVSGRGGLPFSEGGHFVVIRAVTPEGKWLVGDSSHDNRNPDTSTVEYNPAEMIKNFTAGGYSSYAITK